MTLVFMLQLLIGMGWRLLCQLGLIRASVDGEEVLVVLACMDRRTNWEYLLAQVGGESKRPYLLTSPGGNWSFDLFPTLVTLYYHGLRPKIVLIDHNECAARAAKTKMGTQKALRRVHWLQRAMGITFPVYHGHIKIDRDSQLVGLEKA